MFYLQCAHKGLGEFMQPSDNPGQVSYRILRWGMDMAGIPYFGVIDGLLFDAGNSRIAPGEINQIYDMCEEKPVNLLITLYSTVVNVVNNY